MSRSYKKYPLLRIENKKNYKYLNRSLRREKLKEIPKGGYFKKYKSHDTPWCYRWSKEGAIRTYHEYNYMKDDYPTLEQWLNYWKSATIRK